MPTVCAPVALSPAEMILVQRVHDSGVCRGMMRAGDPTPSDERSTRAVFKRTWGYSITMPGAVFVLNLRLPGADNRLGERTEEDVWGRTCGRPSFLMPLEAREIGSVRWAVLTGD